MAVLGRKSAAVEKAKEGNRRPKPRRLLGGRDGSAGVTRYRLYRTAHSRVRDAIQNGYYFEAVTLCESMITDRIEARIQFLKRDEPEYHFIDTLGSRLSQWDLIEDARDGDAGKLIASITEWAKSRNIAVHQFVKVTNSCSELSPEERVVRTRECAEVGLDLVKRISAFVKRHNKWQGQESG